MNRLQFYVNGKAQDVPMGSLEPTMPLITYLRNSGLTGTKLGCGEGGCGACTVMISKVDAQTGKVRHCSANACLFPVYSLDGCAVTTVEGIGGMKEGLHPIQKRIAALHGSQCGYCTPGIVMALYSQLRSKPDSTPEEIEESLDGNLCRCTGYRPILDGAKSLSNNKSSCCGGSGGAEGCCRNKPENTANTGTVVHLSTTKKLIDSLPSLDQERKNMNYTEPIFPPALMRHPKKNIAFTSEKFAWFQPLSLSELLSAKSSYPSAKIVVGNTEIGIETKFKGMEYNAFINPVHVPELNVLHYSKALDGKESGLTVGGAVALNDLREFITTLGSEYETKNKSFKMRGFEAITKMLHWFASNHIRNVCCVAGNIVTASPISDLNPMLLACNATLKMNSVEGVRFVPISEFFIAYRKVNMKPNEILESVFIPTFRETEYIVPFKQARRREDDISIVTSGMKFSLNAEKDRIENVTLGFGGMAPKSIIAVKTCEFLKGKTWNSKTFHEAYNVLRDEMKLPETVPGGQAAYRTTLTLSFLFRAFLTISNWIGYHVENHSASDHSGMKNFVLEEKHPSRGEQIHYTYDNSLPNCHENLDMSNRKTAVGQSIPHRSAEAQVCGDAKYSGDMPLPKDATYAALVLSTRAHAKIVKVDISAAEKCEGFIRYFDYKDIKGSNKIGAIFKDEELFAETEVKFFGAVSFISVLFFVGFFLYHSSVRLLVRSLLKLTIWQFSQCAKSKWSTRIFPPLSPSMKPSKRVLSIRFSMN
jgi:xanthine dehydrogenase/oxidase